MSAQPVTCSCCTCSRLGPSLFVPSDSSPHGELCRMSLVSASPLTRGVKDLPWPWQSPECCSAQVLPSSSLLLRFRNGCSAHATKGTMSVLIYVPHLYLPHPRDRRAVFYPPPSLCTGRRESRPGIHLDLGSGDRFLATGFG